MADSFSVIILAAGKGTRMKSDLAKVLHPVFFEPMICRVVRTVTALQPARTVVVVGHQAEKVRTALESHSVTFAMQHQQLGTGHAVLAAEKLLAASGGSVLILCGDTPLLSESTLANFIASHQREGSALTLMTTTLEDPTHYGRVVCDRNGSVARIVEERDASPEEKKIKLVNAGIYCVDAALLFSALRTVTTDNAQGEVYLTDIVEKARERGVTARMYECLNSSEILGINSRVELAAATEIIKRQRNQQLMLAGVTMLDPATTHIAPSVAIGRDTVIGPHVVMTGQTIIGDGCTIGPFVVLHDATLGREVTVGPFVDLAACVVGPGERVAAPDNGRAGQ